MRISKSFSHGDPSSNPSALDIYHVSFREERLAIRVAVYLLFLLDIAQSVAVTEQAWQMVGNGWGRLDVLNQADWSFVAIPIISGLSEYARGSGLHMRGTDEEG